MGIQYHLLVAILQSAQVLICTYFCAIHTLGLKNYKSVLTFSPGGPGGPGCPTEPSGPWKVLKKTDITKVLYLFIPSVRCGYLGTEHPLRNPPTQFPHFPVLINIHCC